MCISLRFTVSDYLFGIFKPLVIYVFVFLLDLASDYVFGIFKQLVIYVFVFLLDLQPLWNLQPLVIYVFVFLLDLRCLITSLESSNLWLFMYLSFS